jgi:hypothetical protein
VYIRARPPNHFIYHQPPLQLILTHNLQPVILILRRSISNPQREVGSYAILNGPNMYNYASNPSVPLHEPLSRGQRCCPTQKHRMSNSWCTVRSQTPTPPRHDELAQARHDQRCRPTQKHHMSNTWCAVRSQTSTPSRHDELARARHD